MNWATYYHASLYRFNQAGCEVVFQRLRHSLQDASVQCSYDPDADTFLLRCPSELGPQADTELHRIISEIIGEQNTRDEDDDDAPNAPSHLTRFPESVLHSIHADGFAAEDNLEDHGVQTQVARAETTPAPVLRIISTGKQKDALLDCLRLTEIPPTALGRILGSSRHDKAVSRGAILCAVRPGDNGSMVFCDSRGRSAAQAPLSTQGLPTATFPVLTGRKIPTQTIQAAIMESEVAHPPASGPDIAGWMANTTAEQDMESPEQTNVPNLDAKMFTFNTVGVPGRAREPKILDSDSDSEKENSEDEEPGTTHNPLNAITAFNNLLLGISMPENESTKEDGASQTPAGNEGKAPEVSTDIRAEVSSKASSLTSPISSFLGPGIPVSSARTRDRSSVIEDPVSGAADAQWPEWDKRFSMVNKRGLEEHPQARADWNRENFDPRQRGPRSRGAIRARNVSIAKSVVSSYFPLAERSGGVTPSGVAYSDSHPAWENILVMPKPSEELLIDTTDSPANDEASALTKTSTQKELLGSMVTTGAPKAQPTDEDLMRFSSSSSQPLEDDIAGITEQCEPAGPADQLRSTMRQQAGNNRKQKKTENASMEKGAIEHTKPNPQVLVNPDGTIEKQVGYETFQQVLPHMLRNSGVVEVQFGIALLSCLGKSISDLKHPGTAGNWQRMLNKQAPALKTTFFDRLTTAESDAAYLLGLPGEGQAMTATSYEIHARESLTSKVTSFAIVLGDDVQEVLESNAEHEDVLVSTHATPLAFLHFPSTWWDAAVKSVSYDKVHSEAKEFARSIQTYKAAPSFVAKLPKGLTAVVRVLAKREFTKPIQALTGAYLVVTEVQELFIQHVNSPGFDVLATCLSPEEARQQQKFWYETKLVFKASEIEARKARHLERIIQKFIPLVQSVGLGNLGRWEQEEPVNELEKKGTSRNKPVMPGTEGW